jgi:hypothetical protein
MYVLRFHIRPIALRMPVKVRGNKSGNGESYAMTRTIVKTDPGLSRLGGSVTLITGVNTASRIPTMSMIID